MASSVGDMANLATGIGIVPYALQQAGNIGQQRAQNNGTGNASLSDILTAAPAAAAASTPGSTVWIAVSRSAVSGLGSVASKRLTPMTTSSPASIR